MRLIKIGGLLVLIMLVLLVFFSRTIYNYNIPEVTAVLPVNGRLEKSETASGVAGWADTYEIYFELGGKVEEIFVAEGAYVAEGEAMARLSFELDELRLKLTQLRLEKDKTELTLETSRLRMDKLKAQTAELEAEGYEQEPVSDYNAVQLAAKLEKALETLAGAQERYAQLEVLYEVGAIPLSELNEGKAAVDNAAFEADATRREYENAQRVIADNIEANAKAVTEQEKARRKQLDEWAYEMETLQRDIQSKELEIRKNLEEQASCTRLLDAYEQNVTIHAPKAGAVVTLGVKQGQVVAKNQFFAELGLGDAFEIVYSLSLLNNFVAAGDECRISNTDHAFVAEVVKLTPAANAKEATVRVSSDEISAGETFEAEFGKESAKSATLVPNGAVNKDSDGYFVYYIKKRKGILGEEYYAERVAVYIGDSDNRNTVITKGITFFEPIVHLADKPLSNGLTVKVKNEGDLFAD